MQQLQGNGMYPGTPARLAFGTPRQDETPVGFLGNATGFSTQHASFQSPQQQQQMQYPPAASLPNNNVNGTPFASQAFSPHQGMQHFSPASQGLNWNHQVQLDENGNPSSLLNTKMPAEPGKKDSPSMMEAIYGGMKAFGKGVKNLSPGMFCQPTS